MILAIDPGMTSAWATTSGELGNVFLDRLDFGRGLAAWWNHLAHLLVTFQPRLVVIERPFFMGRMRDSDITSALYLSCHAMAWQHDVPRQEYSAAQVRKALMGRARGCTDRQRIEAAHGFGFPVKNDHQADAVLLLVHARRQTPNEGGTGN